MNTKKETVAMPTDTQQALARTATDTFSLQVSNLSLPLGGKTILQHISFDLPKHGMNILIGPSGAGKSTLLRCLNRLHDTWRGEIRIMNQNVRQWPDGSDALRRQVGLIAQKPAVFPCSIERNVVFGLNGGKHKHPPAGLIEQVLRQAVLWDEVKNRLRDDAATLSIGQQQRLCIARALALSPSMLLLDEPSASLDPHSKQLIETSLLQLAETMAVLCVTHDIEQARRMGGQIMFMCNGRMIETGPADTFFTRPEQLETREFLRWTTCDCSDPEHSGIS